MAAAVVTLAVAGTLAAATWAAHQRERDTQAAAPAGARFVRAADVDMLIQQRGPDSGEPIVFVSGVGAWSATWLPTMDALARAGYRTIAIDLPPFGYTSRPAAAANAYDTEHQAARILGALDTLGVSKAVLVGHSFGGRATVEALMTQPSRFSAAVFVDVALQLDPPAARAPGMAMRALEVPPLRHALIAATATNPFMTGWFLDRFTSRHDALTPQVVDVYQRPLSQRGTTDAYGDWLGAFLGDPGHSRSNRSAQYASLTMPVAVIWGQTDSVTPLAEGERLAKLLPNATLKTLPGIGHIPHVEDNAAFDRALLAFLAQGHPATPTAQN
ncbi:alpha/beta hydrolase [Trinickia fusca]|uniref:Alpha/beta hydrolase n=2 Tax=Trinickia fusca TaxID=2419777 RepID=A0A494XJQ3_9BURK|nr:alpha/beta hydrolase [Trinickia fusca]